MTAPDRAIGGVTPVAVCGWCKPKRILYPDGSVGGVYRGDGPQTTGICKDHQAEMLAAIEGVDPGVSL